MAAREVWMTRTPATVQKIGEDKKQKSPVEVTLPGEGVLASAWPRLALPRRNWAIKPITGSGRPDAPPQAITCPPSGATTA